MASITIHQPTTHSMLFVDEDKSKFMMPASISLKPTSDASIHLSFQYSKNCQHEFILNPYNNEFINKQLNFSKKPANRFILFRSCFSNAASKRLHCTEQLCPLSALSKKDHLHFISLLSSHIYKQYKSVLFNVFAPLYENLKRSKQNNTETYYCPSHTKNPMHIDTYSCAWSMVPILGAYTYSAQPVYLNHYQIDVAPQTVNFSIQQ
ncbi:10502_t:CDS:1, partial [Ambispora leptoticha]